MFHLRLACCHPSHQLRHASQEGYCLVVAAGSRAFGRGEFFVERGQGVAQALGLELNQIGARVHSVADGEGEHVTDIHGERIVAAAQQPVVVV